MIKQKLIILSVALLVAVVSSVVVFTACGNKDAVSFEGTDDKSSPIETAITAIVNGDGEGYYSAFPPELKEAYEDGYVIKGTFAPCNTMSEYLTNYMVKVNKANYGEDYTLAVEFFGEEQITVAELDDMNNDPNLDYYTYKRFVTEENTEEVWRIKLKLSYEGSYGNEEKEQSVYVVKQDGCWYLHPHFVFFGF